MRSDARILTFSKNWRFFIKVWVTRNVHSIMQTGRRQPTRAFRGHGRPVRNLDDKEFTEIRNALRAAHDGLATSSANRLST